MDSARAHLHSEDFNPREKHHKPADLQRRRLWRSTIRDVQESLRIAQKEEIVVFLRAFRGSRVPEVFKVREWAGGVAGRAPIPPGARTRGLHMGENERRLCG